MDGLAEDADVLFLLTTNRPDVLEPALAARPGRIDQSVELPLPDATDRRRLIELYARGLELRSEQLDDVVERLDGASRACPPLARGGIRRSPSIAGPLW
jgi:ATP-dependent 26S proteasome regulatory subunit